MPGLLILVRPHTSLLDGLAVARGLYQQGLGPAVFPVDPDYALHPVWRRFLNVFGKHYGGHEMVPLDAGSFMGLRTILHMLRDGRTVVVFPQGIGVDIPDRPDAPGARWLARKSACRVWGMQLDHRRWWPAISVVQFEEKTRKTVDDLLL